MASNGRGTSSSAGPSSEHSVYEIDPQTPPVGVRVQGGGVGINDDTTFNSPVPVPAQRLRSRSRGGSGVGNGSGNGNKEGLGGEGAGGAGHGSVASADGGAGGADSDSTTRSKVCAVVYELRWLLGLVLVEFIAATLYLDALPTLAGTYFGKPHYHGLLDLDCSKDYHDHTPEKKACTKGIGYGALINGVSNAVAAVLTFLLSPMLGVWSDRIGRKKFLVASQILSACPLLSMSLYLLKKWPVALYAYYVFQAVNGCINTVSLGLAYAADILRPADRATGFGLLLAALSISLLIGPSVGGFLPLTLVAIVGFVVVVVTIAMSLLLPESLPPSARTAASETRELNPFKPLLILTKTSLFRKMSLTVIFDSAGEFGKLAILTYYLKDSFDFGRQSLAVIFFLIGLTSMVTMGALVKPFMAWFGGKSVVLIGLAGFLLDSVVLATTFYFKSAAKYLIYPSTSVFAAFGMMGFPAISAIKSNNVSKSQQGHVQGALYGVRSLSQGTAQLLFPLLYQQLPDNLKNMAMFATGALFVFGVGVASTFGPTSVTGVDLQEPPQATSKYSTLLDDRDARLSGDDASTPLRQGDMSP